MNGEPKPLQPMSSGQIVIIGVPGTFDEQLSKHPRVVIWNSEKEHWSNKDLPVNTKAVFFGRFLAHTVASRLIGEARKRHITLFNANGTGMISKQVRELLGMPAVKVVDESLVEKLTPTSMESVPTPEPVPVPEKRNKLSALVPFIDLTLGPAENGRRLYAKAKELGIQTTLGSVTQMVIVQRKKAGGPRPAQDVRRGSRPMKATVTAAVPKELDASVEMFDGIVKGLQDMRDFLIATVEENQRLKQRILSFRKVLDGEVG